MTHVEFDMHRGNTLVTLADILALVTPGERTWRLLEFCGVGVVPRGMTMPAFEALVLAEGCSMDWTELQQFAANIEQTWDCLIVALSARDRRSNDELRRAEGAGADLIIEGIDSAIGAFDPTTRFGCLRSPTTVGAEMGAL